ncbi:MAG: hypothetical protein ACR2FE_10315, partial [Aeromicrobium sp.]
MTDERRTIGSGGQAGRGNRSTSPSAAARSLAGGAGAKKPVTKAKAAKTADPKPSGPKPAKKPATKKPPAAEKSSIPPSAPRLRAVTDEDAAAAAAAAAEEGARQTRTAGPGAVAAGIPLPKSVVALGQATPHVFR